MNSSPYVSGHSGTVRSLTQLKPASPQIPLLTIHMLGRFAVYRGDELIADSAWKRRKAKTLFKLLLLAPNYQLLKDRALEWLWPDQDPERATNNLHRTLFILRRVLQPNLNSAAASHYVLFKDGALSLNPEAIAQVDIEEFDRLIRLARQQGGNLAHYESARALYQGDFLPEDLYEDWAHEYREMLRSTYCASLHHMAQLHLERQAYNEAISCLEDLLGVEATNEGAYRELMRLYALIGQRHQALRLYQQAREILQRELDVEPSAETIALYRAIVEDRWQLAPETTSALLATRPATPLAELQARQPLVGRALEINQLEALMQQAKAGHGTVVILSGEQGVGKTRLAEEMLWRARAAGMQILYGAAYEQEGHLPYGPFVEVMRDALAGQALWEIRQKFGVLVKDLARLLPELADSSLPPATRFELAMGQERQRLFDAVTTTFLTLAKDSPLVLFLDDLHAAGESSLQLLHYLARRVADVPILILCTIREEEAQRGTPIARLCSELTSNHLAQRLHLPRLNSTDTAQLCSQLLGGLVHPTLAETLYQLTEGNPFFIHALVLALIESGKLEQDRDCWHFPPTERLAIPASIRDVIGLRLERLSEEAYRLVGLAAVIGREFSYDLLRATTQWNDASLLDLLDEALGAYLIEETEAGYRFHHGLIRQVIYDELTLHRRAWLHGQVAQAMERLTAQQLDERVAILAYHYERAEHYDVAVRYLVRAGDRAQATYAPREALDHYNRALILRHQHPEVVTRETMADLLKRRAQTHLALSDFDAAISDLEQLLQNDDYPSNQLREGEILYQLGIAHYWAHRLERAAYYLDQAIRLATTLQYDELHAKALKLRDILNSTQGNMGQVTSIGNSRLIQDAHSLPVEEHWGHAMLAHLRSDFETARYHAQACVELGQSLGNTFLMLGGYFVLGMSCASLGCYQIALDHLTYALDLSEATGERFWRARLLNTVGWVYRELFHLDKAITFDQASLELARTSQPRLTEAEGNALANLATDYLLRQDYDQTRLFLAEGLKAFSNEPFMRWRYRTRMIIIKGRLELAEGNVMAALAAADEALTVARNTRARKNIARSCRLRGEAFMAARRVKRARAALRHALYVSLSVKSPALIWPCHLTLAKFEETQHRYDVAKMHYFGAAQILHQITGDLTRPSLYEPFLDAPPVRLAFSKAVCPIRLLAKQGELQNRSRITAQQ